MRVARRDNYTRPIVVHAPGRMRAATAATEIGARQQHGCSLVARKIKNETWIWFFAGQIAPLVEKNASAAVAGESFQKLFGHHLIGIDVDAVERHHFTGVR